MGRELNIDTKIESILTGNTSLGIELGSTRIKAVLVDHTLQIIATGYYDWENQFIDNNWTYSLESVWTGLQECYAMLKQTIFEHYHVTLKTVGSIGISAMMHGYLVFDQDNQLLTPFRTWRNAQTATAAKKLTELFQYNIPQRWSIAHLYQSLLNHEPHTSSIAFMTTLAGYVHWKLTNKKVLGIGDASGMFPIDTQTKAYDPHFMSLVQEEIKALDSTIELSDILPQPLLAGHAAGFLTVEGASLLDPSGDLESGSVFCPPEGDAGTGMTATNSITPKTGNISAGTSAFAMIVLDTPLTSVHEEIDLVTTPDGHLVAMVHANNCSSEINSWMTLFKEVVKRFGTNISTDELYSTLFTLALEGDPDCGGLLSYGYHSGENITQIETGYPLFIRSSLATFNLKNVMRMHLASAFGAMAIGMEILYQEHVEVENIVAHGGLFKTPKVAQTILSSAIHTPVTVMETANEGGAWGIALLAAYVKDNDLSLPEYLQQHVFKAATQHTIMATHEDIEGYTRFIDRYKQGLELERSASQLF